MKLTKESKQQLAEELAKVGGYGHYLDRLERMAETLDRRDIVNAIYSVRQIYNFLQCKPTGIDGILNGISMRILFECERLKFSKTQLNMLYWGLYDARSLGLQPLPESRIEKTLSNG